MNVIFVSAIGHDHKPDCMIGRANPTSCYEQEWESYSIFFEVLDRFAPYQVPPKNANVHLPSGRYYVKDVEWTVEGAIVYLKNGAQ